MKGFLVLVLILLLSAPVMAQEVTSSPLCFKVRNTAEFKVYGSFVTDYYTNPEGTRARHRSNFRLDEAGATDPDKGFATDEAEFCSYGPFYPGHQLELVLRTLVPVFSCKTSVEAGEIIIRGERKDDDSGVKMWAECL